MAPKGKEHHPDGGGKQKTHQSQDLNELAAERNRAAHNSPMRQGAMDEMARKRWKLAEVRLDEEEEAIRKGLQDRTISASDWLLGCFEPDGRPAPAETGRSDFKPPERKPKPLPRTKDGYGNPKQEKCGTLAVWYSNSLPHAKQRGSDARRLMAEGRKGRNDGDKVYRPFDSWTGTNCDPVYQPGVKSFNPNATVKVKVLSPSSKAQVDENCMSGNWPRPEGAAPHLSLEMALAVQRHPRPDWKAYCDGRPPWKGWGESIGAFSLDEVIKRGILHDPVWALDSVRFRSRELWRGSPSVGEMGRWAAQPVSPAEPWMSRHPYRGENAPETEEERLVKIFNLMDVDGSGAISGDELANAMGLMGLKFSGRTKKAILKEMDEDGSGEIDLEEFLAFFRKLKGQGPRQKDTRHLPVIGMWARVFHKDDWRSKEDRHVTLTGPGTAGAPVHARMRSGSPTRWPGWPKPPWKGWGANYGIFSLDNIIKRGILHTRAGEDNEFTKGKAQEEARFRKKQAKGASQKGFLPPELRVELPLGVTAQSFNTAEGERQKLDKLRRAGVLGNYFLVKKVMSGEIKEHMDMIMDEEEEDIQKSEFTGINFRRIKSAHLDSR